MTRRGRATKSESGRNVRLGIRVSPDEKVELFEKAGQAGMSISEYVREQALNGCIEVKPSDREMPFELILQLKRIGTNLNQIARVMNSGFDTPPELQMTCQLIERIVMEQIIKGSASNDSW